MKHLLQKFKRKKSNQKGNWTVYGLVLALAVIVGVGWGRFSPAQDRTPRSPVQLVLNLDKRVVVQDGTGKEGVSWQFLPEQAQVQPGDVIRYRLVGKNNGAQPVSSLVLMQPIPAQTVYIINSAKGENATITYSIDNGKSFVASPMIQVVGTDGRVEMQPAPVEAYTHVRWMFEQSIDPGAEVTGQFEVRVK